MKKFFYLVSRNVGKLREIQDIVAPFHLEVRNIHDFYPLPEIEETGVSYAENALLKARYGFQLTGEICVGEDSGLEIDALDGAPGIQSARFGGSNLPFAEKIAEILKRLEGVPPEKRSARFVCVVALVFPGGEKLFEGICEGWIAQKPEGNQGFGYDPIFVFPPFAKTFAQLGPNVKNRYSHRAQAFRKCAEFLIREL
ncbi:MAG: RdgB/HAM1 family non-canonical purine NTP pyrophosphatase [Candidatus Atribacteria bacterium]|nr:RdgB/HAM1 family non-canonical purine NTP pyrophosphatase [Candidatus Atribacteria bacterium]